MKKQSLLLLLCMLGLFRVSYAQTCSGTTNLNTASGSFEDGSGGANYSNNLDCRWLISTGIAGSTVALRFPAFDIEDAGSQFDKVILYDGPTTGSPVIATLSGNAISSLTGYFSTGNQMLVRFTTDNTVPMPGWSAEYSTRYCGGNTNMTGVNGSFTDGSGGSDYGNFESCSWLINPGTNATITLNFSSVNTENAFDFVKIYDGSNNGAPLLASLTGNVGSAGPYVSTGSTLFVEFTSDYLFVNSGFSANYTSKFCSGSSNFTSNVGSFTDGSTTGNYGDNQDCYWLINPGVPYQTISLYFSQFSTESGFDFVTIYDGPTVAAPILAQYSGGSIPPATTSTGNQMLVRFNTDFSNQANGFSANYVSNIYCGGVTNLTAPSGTFNDGSPGNYADYADCSWLINPGAGFDHITMNFSSFCTEAGFDYVDVYDGPNASAPSLGHFSGNTLPANITSSGSTLFVRFTTDLDNTLGPCYDGFVANYQAHYCKTTTTFVTAPGSFGDGSGPANYLNETNCTWLINPPLGSLEKIGIHFTQFSTEGGFDVVNIYDGPNNAAPLLASYSGNSLPADVHTANTHPMFVEFITDATTTKAGWLAEYVVNCTPTISISGNSIICAGETSNFTATIVNGGAGPVVNWFVNGVPSGAPGVNYSSSTLHDGDVVTATLLSNAACAFPTLVTSNAVTMTVHPLPTVGITSMPSPPNVCDGESVTLNGTGAVSYSWDNGITDGVPFVQGVGTTTYTVTGTDANGCTNTASIDVTVWPLPTPVITSNTGSFSFCNGSALVLDAGAGYDAYQWSIGATTQAIGTASGNTYTVTVTDGNGCTASTSETTIRLTSVPARPGTITGTLTGLCNTSGNVYYISPVLNADSYVWTVTNGIITSGQGTETIEVEYFGFSSSTITVRAHNACGNSSSRSLTVSAKPAVPLTINGNKYGVCKNMGEIYSIDPVDGADNYKWTVPSHVTIVNGQGTNEIEVNFSNSFSSGNICVRAQNSCGNSSYFCMNVHAKAQKPIVINGPTGVCHNQSGVVYWTPAVYGASSYTWSVPSGAVIQSGQGTPTITVKFGTHSGNVKVKAKNSCGSSDERSLSIHIVCREAGDLPTGEVNVYPNPTHSTLKLDISSELDQKCYVRMIDVIGKQLMYDAFDLKHGGNLQEYDVTGFAKGLYFLVIERDGLPSETIRVVVE